MYYKVNFMQISVLRLKTIFFSLFASARRQQKSKSARRNSIHTQTVSLPFAFAALEIFIPRIEKSMFHLSQQRGGRVIVNLAGKQHRVLNLQPRERREKDSAGWHIMAPGIK